jgi:hypothetical protein
MTLGSPVQLAIEMSAGVFSELCSAQDDAMNITVSLAVTSYKGKAHSINCHEGTDGEHKYNSVLSLTSALDGGGWSTPHPGRFTPEKDPILTVQESRWAPGPVWTGEENLAPMGIRSPERPARSQSLCRLRYVTPYSLAKFYRYTFFPQFKGKVRVRNYISTEK